MKTVPVFEVGPHCMDWDMVVDLLERPNPRICYEFSKNFPDTRLRDAVILVAARHVAPEVVAGLTAKIENPVVILLSDEECSFDETKVPGATFIVQTPAPRHAHSAVGFLPVGYSRAAKLMSQRLGRRAAVKTTAVGFIGQVTHPLRRAWAGIMGDMAPANWDLEFTEGFMQGAPQEQYAERVSALSVAPAPSGPVTPDTFRLWEALELGAYPVVTDDPYWAGLTSKLPAAVPAFPVARTTTEALAASLAEATIDAEAGGRARVGSWYLLCLRALRDTIDGCFLGELEGITTIVTASPIASHPDTAIIEDTVDSILHQLPDEDVLILLDGVRPEQDSKRRDYVAHVEQVNALCRSKPGWENVVTVFDDVWRHQAMTTLNGLAHVNTDVILFVEHDTPFRRDRKVPMGRNAQRLREDQADVVRFHFEAQIPDEHDHLMRGRDGAWIRTIQWSQRPHLAKASYYREMLEENFEPDARTMIEDFMHSVAQRFPKKHRIEIFGPLGESIAYTLHTDGRGIEPKYAMWNGTWPR